VHRDAWIGVPHARDAQVQTTAELARAVERMMAVGERPEMITFASRAFGLNRLGFKGDAGAYADQSGAVATRWASQWERPELWLFDFHHHLFADKTGETVAGVAGVSGVLFVVTGLVLWWRRRGMFELRLLPRKFARPQLMHHHRDLGVILAPLLLLSLVTGSSLVFRPLTALYLGPGAPVVIDKALAAPKAAPAKVGKDVDWGGLIVAGRTRFPDAEVRSLSLPRGKSGLITLRMRQPDEWLPNGRTTLWFAADTGALVRVRDARSLPAVARIYNGLYPVHAAKAGGLAYRLVMTASGLGLAVLGSLSVWGFWFGRPKKRASAA